MKKSVLTIASFVAACSSVFAQGKVSFGNDSLHLVFYDPDPSNLKAGDASLAGQAVTTTATPSGSTFIAGLYAGTASTALALQGTTPFNSSSPGHLVVDQLILSAIPGGSTAFFQVWIWDAAYADPFQAGASGSYIATSPIFTMVPSPGVAYNSIVNPGSPAFSTWAAGTFNLDQYGTGSRGAICISLGPCVTPEPSMPALAGLAAVVLWMRGHLKKKSKASKS